MISLVHCNRSGGLASCWRPIALRSNPNGGLFDYLASFTSSALDEHDFTASIALKALHLRKTIRFGKACAKPKTGGASAPGARRIPVRAAWIEHQCLRLSRYQTAWSAEADSFGQNRQEQEACAGKRGGIGRKRAPWHRASWRQLACRRAHAKPD